jgi:predicted metal-binding membrane protein
MLMFRIQAPPALRQAALAGALSLLAAAAWLALWLGHASHGMLHPHHWVNGEASLSSLLVFAAGWTVMTVAMMLPTTLPLLTTFYAVARDHRGPGLLVGLVIVGYLLAWAGFGAVVWTALLATQALPRLLPVLADYTWAGGPLVLLLAGAFQFSSLKYRCLDKCRSPLSFVLEHWQGRNYHREAFRLGFDHGLFCVGCCWALMLLMFAVGAGSFAWMLLLALVMAIEKNLPWGRRLSAPLGAGLLAAGLAWLAFLR